MNDLRSGKTWMRRICIVRSMQMMESNIIRRQRERAAALRPLVRGRRTHEERSAHTQSALVEAAISTLCDLGYAGVTTAEVAKRAGCTTGAMHHHFGSKGDLLLAVLTRLSIEFEEAYRDVPTFSARDLEHRCASVVDALAAYYRSPRYLAVWELHVGTRGEAQLHRMCVENRARVIDAFESVWTALFSDVSATRAELCALMQFTLTYLRCFGIERSLGVDPDAGAVNLDVLKSALLDKLGAYGAKRVALAPKPVSRRRQ